MKMRWMILLMLLLAATGCSSSNKTGQVSGQSQAPAATTASDAGFEVKVTKNGAELASYNQKGFRGKGALLDGESIQLILSSPDNKHVLMIDVQGTKAGVYPSPTQSEAAKPGEARLNFMTVEPPTLIPDKGQTKLTELTDEYCSGTFTATGTDINGAKFSIEGSFSKLQVMKAS